jgi:hypothetical protein
MPHIKLEHIDALSRGKKSGIRIGSRAVPHHLYAHERGEYERALTRGYLSVDHRTRVNLENLWMLVCQSRGSAIIVLRKVRDRSVVEVDGQVVFDGGLADGKKYVESII